MTQSEINKHAKNHIDKASLRTLVLFLPEIRELLAARDFSQLKLLINKLHSIDLAQGWNKLEPHEKILLFKLLSFKIIFFF